MTTKMDIIWELEKNSLSVREISLKFNREIKEIISDLKHISKSILPKKKLIRDHAICRNCGFVFKDNHKFTSPTKCPKCRHESISEVKFLIK